MIMNDVLEEIVNIYEEKLKKDNPTFEFKTFERMLIKQGIVYGYEYKEHEIKDENNQEVE